MPNGVFSRAESSYVDPWQYREEMGRYYGTKAETLSRLEEAAMEREFHEEELKSQEERYYAGLEQSKKQWEEQLGWLREQLTRTEAEAEKERTTKKYIARQARPIGPGDFPGWSEYYGGTTSSQGTVPLSWMSEQMEKMYGTFGRRGGTTSGSSISREEAWKRYETAQDRYISLLSG